MALFIGAAACTAGKDCTLVGCRDAVLIHAPLGISDLSEGTLTVCIDGQCQDRRFNDRSVDVPSEDMEEGDEVTAVLVMPDGTRFHSIRTIPIVVVERSCASGRSASGRIEVDVSYRAEEVHLDVGVRPLRGDQDCQGNPDTPHDVALREPLGDREITGESWPAP